MTALVSVLLITMIPIDCKFKKFLMGYSISNQKKEKRKSRLLLTFMKFGTNVDPIKKLSHTKNLAHFIGLPSSDGHSKFLHNFFVLFKLL